MRKFEMDYFSVLFKWLEWGPAYQANDRSGNPIFYARKKFFSKIIVLENKDDKLPLLTITPVTSLSRNHLILDSEENLIGKITEKFSFLNARWDIIDPLNNVLGVAEEKGFSLFKRVINISLAGKPIGVFYSKSNFGGDFVMDLSNDSMRYFDRRIATALAFFLCDRFQPRGEG